MREAIMGHKRSSDLIRSHQRSSEQLEMHLMRDTIRDAIRDAVGGVRLERGAQRHSRSAVAGSDQRHSWSAVAGTPLRRRRAGSQF
jgi:hypothetical protein